MSARAGVFSEKYSFWTNTLGTLRYDGVLSHLPPSPGVLLDAACGDGLFALRLAERMDYVVGLDISRSLIALARQHQARLRKANVAFLCADLESLPFEKPAFDYVVSVFALRHTRLEVTVPGLCRLLRPGGRLIISDLITPNPRLDRCAAWHVLCVLRNAVSYTRAFGFRTMWRLLSFELSPPWIRHLTTDPKMTAPAFQAMYRRLLPACRLEGHRWRMTAIWDAPQQDAEKLPDRASAWTGMHGRPVPSRSVPQGRIVAP